MSTDDKYGIGAGLMALGLAAGVILIGQLTYNQEWEKSLAAAADSSKAEASDAAAVKPPFLYRVIPHRERNTPEAIFDGIVCALALPLGIFFFATAVMSGPADGDSQKTDSKG